MSRLIASSGGADVATVLWSVVAFAIVGCGASPATAPVSTDAGLIDVGVTTGPPIAGKIPDSWPIPTERAAQQVCFAGVTATSAPMRLSEAGCIIDVETLEPSPDLVPYTVNAPLWTDGALKQRYFGLPVNGVIEVEADGNWSFPVGAVLVKNFVLESVIGDARTRRPVETRIMLRRAGGWDFLTYRWDERGVDAVRLAGQLIEPFEVDVDGEPLHIDYLYPDGKTCLACHSSSAKLILGPRTEQMNGPAPATPRKAQLDLLSTLGVFSAPLDDLAGLPAVPAPTSADATVEAKARAWLHANCAHCHQPGGWTPPDLDLDLRWDTTLLDARVCDVRVQYPLFPRLGLWRMRPGRPDDSAIYTRLLSEPLSRMPPAGVSWPDPTGVELVRRWITQLDACP